MTPTFDPDTTEYTATTANASDLITATPEDEDATVEIGSAEATIAADGTATWAVGENEVEITVENGDVAETYTATVTKTTTEKPLLSSMAFTRDVSDTLTLSPEFASSTFEYTATADATDWGLALDAVSDDAQIFVKIGDADAVEYLAPMEVELAPTGDTVITVTVKEQYHTVDGEYTVTITVE